MNKRYKFIINSLFFLVVFLLLYLVVKPQLIFYKQQVGFIWDSYLMKEYLSVPGGITEYFSLFLFQFSIIPWLGAIVYTIIITGIVFVSDKILSNGKEKAIIILKFVPAILLGMLLSDYSFPLVYLVLLFLQLFYIFLYKSISSSKLNTSLSVVSILLILPVAYCFIGGFAFLLFIISILLYELLHYNEGKIIKVITILILGVAIPVISAGYVFFITMSDAFFRLEMYLGNYKLNSILYVLFLITPVLIVLQYILSYQPTKWKGIAIFQTIHYLLAFAFFVILFNVPFDKDEKQKVEVERYAYLGEWEKVLEIVNEKPSDDRLINFQTNRALFHTGQMPSKLFDYPQKWGIDGLFLTRNFVSDILLPSTQLYLDLSYINEAIHLGNEAVSFSEKSPQIIQQLIIANIIASKYQSASLYINILKKYPFYRKKALKFEKMVLNDTPDEEMLKHRKMMPYTNFKVSQMPAAGDLLSLLLDHPENKMAFEYLMSYYLLKNDVGSFIMHYSKGKDFDYGDLPRIYQEAIVLYAYNLRKMGKSVPKMKIDADVLKDFTDYLKLLAKFKGNKEDAKLFLAENYSNTYWYYIHYTSPITNNLKVVSE